MTETRGPCRANRILALLSRMFSLALIPLAGEDKPWRSPVDGNPCRGVTKNHEEGKGRLYSPAEIAAIGDALAIYQGPAADVVRMVMLTGARPGEVLRAAWSEFDVEPGRWVKPSSHSKVKRKHVVPLAPPALELLDRLRQHRTGDLVFPGVNGAPLITTQRCWEHVRAHAGLDESARLYDLRHSFATTGAQAGLSLAVIGHLLGHSQAQTTNRYARHLSNDPLQQAVDTIASVIAPSRPSATIVKLRG